MYNIIFSLTAHESIECLYDLISNIQKCFINYNITILLSITERLNNNFNNKYDFVKIVTIRDNNFSIWGNINLFHQHMLNIEYICKNNIKYDFFWIVASNEMFIKIVPPDFIDNNVIKIISKKNNDDNEYNTYYNDLFIKPPSWYWTDKYIRGRIFIFRLYYNLKIKF